MFWRSIIDGEFCSTTTYVERSHISDLWDLGIFTHSSSSSDVIVTDHTVGPSLYFDMVHSSLLLD